MGAATRAMMACMILAALAGCGTVPTTAIESQSKPKNARMARLYFIWPRSMMLHNGTIDIKVDGQVVGKIAPDSYFFVDRPPGTHSLRVEPLFDFVYFDADVQVAAGGTYYYAVNMKSTEVPLVGGGFVTLSQPQHGTPMQAKSGGMIATYRLKTLDAAAATTEMAKLDAH